jgi:hypothetical protein
VARLSGLQRGVYLIEMFIPMHGPYQISRVKRMARPTSNILDEGKDAINDSIFPKLHQPFTIDKAFDFNKCTRRSDS